VVCPAIPGRAANFGPQRPSRCGRAVDALWIERLFQSRAWLVTIRRVTDALPPNRLEQRRLLLEQVEGRLEVQLQELDGLDRKATTVLAATGVLLGLVINNAGDFATSPSPVPWVFYGALAVLAVALFAGVRTLWPIKISVVPEPRPFLDQHAAKRPEETMGELANTKAEAFRKNAVFTRTKGDQLRLQMVLLALGGSFLVGAYVLERLI
jgi:hypothetical protein